jgi:hypothetical protein
MQTIERSLSKEYSEESNEKSAGSFDPALSALTLPQVIA